MARLLAEQARDLAMRLAGAAHSRRVYATTGPIWERTVEALRNELAAQLERSGLSEITVGLLGEGIAVCGVPIHAPPEAVVRFMNVLRQRDVEIVSIRRGATASDLETLLAYLGADAADVAGVNAETWLRERGADHVAIKNLKLTKRGLESFRDVYRQGVQSMGREFRQANLRGTVNAGAVSELARSLLDVVNDRDAPIATLLALRDRDDYAFVHSVNVGMLTACQASALGLPDDEVQVLSMAGLLHDIGKARVPESVIGKAGSLTAHEQRLLDAHAVEGARILLETKGIRDVSAIVAACHHRSDASPPILATELCRIADAFDGLRTLRPFDDAEGMRDAARFLILHLRDRFNAYLLERFATLCRLFRPGEEHVLTSGERARIVELHPELSLRPTVEIVEQNGGPSAPGTVVDLSRPSSRGRPKALLVPPEPERFADLEPSELDRLG